MVCTKITKIRIKHSQWYFAKFNLLKTFKGWFLFLKFFITKILNPDTLFPKMFCGFFNHVASMVWYPTAKGRLKDLTRVLKIIRICPSSVECSMSPPVTCWHSPTFPTCLHTRCTFQQCVPHPLTFRHRASCILGQAFRYSPENAFYIFNQKIYFIIWHLLDRASLI